MESMTTTETPVPPLDAASLRGLLIAAAQDAHDRGRSAAASVEAESHLYEGIALGTGGAVGDLARAETRLAADTVARLRTRWARLADDAVHPGTRDGYLAAVTLLDTVVEQGR